MRVAIYARVSTDKQDNDNQLDVLRAKVERRTVVQLTASGLAFLKKQAARNGAPQSKED